MLSPATLDTISSAGQIRAEEAAKVYLVMQGCKHSSAYVSASLSWRFAKAWAVICIICRTVR